MKVFLFLNPNLKVRILGFGVFYLLCSLMQVILNFIFCDFRD